MSKNKCWHVTTTDGTVYGVAAATKGEAFRMTAERLEREDRGTTVRSAALIKGGWTAPYGTVLHY